MAGVAVPGDPNAAGPVTETFAAPDDYGDLRASELHSSLGEQLGAEAGEAFGGGMRSLWRAAGYFAADKGWQPPLSENDARLREPWGPDEPVPSVPDVSMADARARVKQEGLEHQITLPNQPSIHPGVLEMMIRDGHDRTQYNAAVARGPQGFWPSALGAVTQIGAGMIDPVNAAAFSIPLMGEARYGKILATAGENIFARAAIKTGVGAAQGAVGGAALEPLDWWLHTQDGSDYTYADALKSVVLSAGMGGAFHGGFGLAGDVSARLRGLPLEGAHGVAGTHLPEAALGEGVDVNEVPGVAPQAGAPLGENLRERLGLTHPAEMLADLPPEAQEDVLKASIANLTSGRLNNAAEMLQEAAKADPRIAESVDPYLGDHRAEQEPAARVVVPQAGKLEGGELDKVVSDATARAAERPIVETPMPSGANSSRDPNGPVYVDPRVPEPLRRPVAVHETVEEALMARGYPYAEAHKIATQAEKQAVEAAGMDWGRYTHEWDGLLDTIEREKVPKAELPSDLHVDPEAAIGHHRAASKGAATSADVVHLPGRPSRRGPRARPEESWSLNEFLAHRGGIDPNDPQIADLRGSIGRSNKFIPGFGHLIRKGGMGLDHAREAATEAGYLPGEMSGGGSTRVNDLLDAMDRELRGERVYREGHEGTQTKAEIERAEDEFNHRREGAEDDLGRALREVEIDPKSLSPALRARAVEIIMREGADDPINAYERAVMEDDHDGAEAGSFKPAAEKIPGWDELDDAGSAPGARGGIAGRGNGEGGRVGAAARAGGPDDRAPGRPDWHSLADNRSPDDAELASTSREADKAPEPPDTPEKAVTQAEQAAADAENGLKEMLAALPEDERKPIEDALAAVTKDKASHEQMIRETMACLMRAAGAA